jgi:hypothetical protein
MTRLYVLFDALVVAILAVQLWSLVNVARRPVDVPDGAARRARAFLPLLWEFGVAALILVALPSALALTWSEALQSIPDLTVVIIAIAVLWLITGVVRVMRIVQASKRQGSPALRA